jgi:hypothetical protein
MLPLQSFITILVACLAAGYAAVSNRQNMMGEVFGIAAVSVFFATIAGQFCFPVTPNTALPLTFIILTASIAVAGTHFACSREREKQREFSRPNFEIEIEQIEFVGSEPPSHNLSFAIELILHNHGADSGARNWSPVVEFMDGHRVFFSETVLRYYPAGPHALGENITRSTALIARYGKQRGWLMFSVQCAALYDPRNLLGGGLNEIKQVTIFVSDYAGGTYKTVAHVNHSVKISMDELFRTYRVS